MELWAQKLNAGLGSADSVSGLRYRHASESEFGECDVRKEQRRFERLKMRLSCKLHFDGRVASGMVIDLSARGLFVRMGGGVKPPAGLVFRLVLTGADCGDLELMARIARTKIVRRELVLVAAGGVGLELLSAPEAYYELLKPLTES